VPHEWQRAAGGQVSEDDCPAAGAEPVQGGRRGAGRADRLKQRGQGSGDVTSPGESSIAARRRRLHRAQRCFSNILSSVPQSPHTLLAGSPAQLAQVSAPGPGGLTGRRT